MGHIFIWWAINRDLVKMRAKNDMSAVQDIACSKLKTRFCKDF